MVYRIDITLFFSPDNKKSRDNLHGQLKGLLKHATNINKGKLNEELCFTQIHKCYHDETPTRPCVLEERIEKTD